MTWDTLSTLYGYPVWLGIRREHGVSLVPDALEIDRDGSQVRVNLERVSEALRPLPLADDERRFLRRLLEPNDDPIAGQLLRRLG